MASCPTPISALSSTNPTLPKRPSSPFTTAKPKGIPKELFFNHDSSATKKLLAGVSMVAELVGVTLGPKGRNVVLQNKYGPPKIVNDGETVLKEIELEDSVENVGVKLVRQAGAKTNDLAGDGSTTAVILAHGLITEGVKVTAAGMNPIQIARGIEKTAVALVSELKLMSREIEDHELADIAAVSAGNDYTVGNMIYNAICQVGKKGVVSIEKGKSTENNLQIVEGMQFDRGYLSPYFVTDRQKMIVEFQECKVITVVIYADMFTYEVTRGLEFFWLQLLLVDKKITHPEELFKILDNAVKEKYPVVIVAEGIEQEALTPIIRNKLRGALKAVAIKAPAFGERKSHYLDDIAILTGATVVRDEMGMILHKTGPEVLGTATKVVITKDSTLIVTDGSTRESVDKRVSQIQRLVENTEEAFQKKILNERIGRLSGGIAILQVGAQTQVELKDKQLRIEDALNATKAAIEEGVVVGGGCCLLRLSKKVAAIKELLDNEEQKIGAEIFKKALSYPAKMIAKNAGVNGSVVVEKVLSNAELGYGYNAATDCYEDLMKAGIMDPTKVVRCCLEHAASVAKTFLLSDAVVVEIKESNPIPTRMQRRRRKPPLPPMPQMPQTPQMPQMPPISSMPSMPPMSMPTSGARAFGSKYGR
ncbi:ruBisCO large subunit-binding protein subunit beta, chloroplastic isoform X2 [Argentina anserina]|uniref:ruBisCO large subunit-binding protein subunit beta, chloroplastic isoform X2 n=1 Tax=Argentina anserina TaxID=57926 RepID=UPI0021763F63|nr:ruBisCO large subunit-binding protein subunit beta, chloroplastic isoform X2 [Potentilla anserina]